MDVDFMKPQYDNCCCRQMNQCPFESECFLTANVKTPNYRAKNALQVCTSSAIPPLVVPFPEPYEPTSESPQLHCYCDKTCTCPVNLSEKAAKYDRAKEKTCHCIGVCTCYTGTKPEKTNENEIKKNVQPEDIETRQYQTARKKDDKKMYSQKKTIEKSDSEIKANLRAAKDEVNNIKDEQIGNTSMKTTGREKSQTSYKSNSKKKRNTDSINYEKNVLVQQYLEGMYPGTHVGHRNCLDPLILVPSTMGWLWNLEESCSGLEPRRGWRPGAIDKVILRKIRLAKRAAGIIEDNFQVTPGSKKKRTRPASNRSKLSISKDVEEGDRPTLLLHQTKGKYHVEMNPLILNEADDVDVRKPLEIKVIPKRKDDSESGSSTDSSLEVQLICPENYRKKYPRSEVISEDIETEVIESKQTVSLQEKKKVKKGAK